MQQAGLNTLLGMGTTFFILILLSLIIAGFGKLFVALDKRKAEKDAAERKAAAASQSAPAAAPAPVAAQSDDGALIAVIAAAVSAYREQAEPTVAPDGFVVRKIRRIGRK
jgi:sodium pump decarboxylase gamma subunit